MKFGVTLGMVNPGLWVKLAEQADRLGFDSVWLPEHLVLPVVAHGSPTEGEDHPPIPSTMPTFDAFVVLAHVAARTERVRLGINVYNIGLRHPFITARAAVTLDMLSAGRLELGIGSSWLREEWEAVQQDFDTRGARVDETIEICRRLWSEPTVEHHGRFFDFAPVAFEPKPVQEVDGRKGIPLIIGGDGAAALRRTATVGAGWLPMNHSLEQLRTSVDTLFALTEKAGRDPAELSITVQGLPKTPDELAAYEKAGVTRLIVRPWERSSGALDGLNAFAEAFGVS